MCRFFALVAQHPVGADEFLVDDAHSLLRQSARDARGKSHGDGWGIGHYEQGRPIVVRRCTNAVADEEFVRTARQVRSRVVMAHVRQASVGRLSEANTHPFHHGRWMFAHNGTVTGFSKVGEQMRAELKSELARQVQGETDSELVFYWLLGQIREAGLEERSDGHALQALAVLVRESIRRLDAWCRAAARSKTARLNFLLTDGRRLVASRWHHSLHWREAGPDDGMASEAGRLATVASEPIGPGEWGEVPEESVLTIDCDAQVQITPN